MTPSASTQGPRVPFASRAQAPGPQVEVRRAFALQGAGDHPGALALAETILERFPKNADALLVAGQSNLMLGRAEDAIEYFDAVLRLRPKHAIALNNRGAARQKTGQLQAALKDFKAACRLERNFEDALLNQASCLQILERHEEALAVFNSILSACPDHPEAAMGVREHLRAAKQFDECEAALRVALKKQPTDGMLWYELGNTLLAAKRYEEAVTAYGETSNLLPEHAPTYSNCATALRELKQFDDALLVTDAALQIDPDCIPAWHNKSLILLELNQWVLAVEAAAELLKRKPDDALAHINLGFALHSLRQYPAALDAFQTASRHDPKLIYGWFNQANTLELLRRHEEVGECYARVLELNPNYPNLLGHLGHSKHFVCDWRESSEWRNQIMAKLDEGYPSCDPFRAITFTHNADEQQRLARRWLQHLPALRTEWTRPTIQKRDRIRVGYFSADFHHHATSMLMAQFLEMHDRSRFEIIGFSFGERVEDKMKQRIRSSMDGFHDILTISDDEAAHMVRDLGLDIAVDLKGHTKDGRIGLFQRRLAPIQIAYLGYPGTAGGDFMDYIIADRMIIPDELRQYYDEKVIRVPGTYQANDASRHPDPHRPSRSELGLPEQGFVFACFNNNYKITPEMFDIWMRLLHKVPGSVLWLLADNPTAQRNLRMEAERRGIDSQRLIFAPRIYIEQHLARQQAADLFLDTLPCNAHTTASDALRVGLPVVTCTGTSFASRVAASLLSAQGLDELITSDLVAYEQLALSLATDPNLLLRIRKQAEAAIGSGQLLNTQTRTRSIERAYEHVVERALAGLKPEHFDA
jgi:protein O-GlcNAc transferase